MIVNFPDLFTQAYQFLVRGQLTEAIAAYRDIATLATEKHETSSYARALYGAGMAATYGISERSSSYYRDALSLLGEALQKAQALGDPLLEADIYRQMGVAAHTAHDFASAAVFFQKSLERLEGIDEAEASLADTYARLGAHLGRLGQFEGAENMLNKALSLFEKVPFAGKAHAEARAEMAIVNFRQGKLEKAAEYSEEAAGWFEADHDREKYDLALCRLYGLLMLIKKQSGDSRGAKQYQVRYDKLLKGLEVVAAGAIQSELNLLAR